MEAMEKREDIYTLRYMQQLYQSQYGAVSGEVNRVVGYLEELNAAQKAVDNTDEIAGRGVLVHMGSGVYLNGKAGKMSSVIVSVGGGYLIEKDITEAKKYIASRIEHTTNVFNKLIKNRNELGAALREVSIRLEAMGSG